jgi:hypothetical protein
MIINAVSVGRVEGVIELPNKRDLKLDDYGISNKRYKELCGFCEQYREWKDELEFKKDIMKSKVITDMPIPPSRVSNPQEELAIRRTELQAKCELIEQTAIQADTGMYQYIIKSVTEEVPCWYLEEIMGMPYCRKDFYAARRYFYFLLDKNKR